MKQTILHSAIGVAGAVIVGLSSAQNVLGQTVAPPAALPPTSPGPGLTPPVPIPATPPAPAAVVPPPPKVATPEVLEVTPVPVPSRSGGKTRPPGVPGGGLPPGSIPGTSGEAAPAIADPAAEGHEHGEPPGSPAAGGMPAVGGSISVGRPGTTPPMARVGGLGMAGMPGAANAMPAPPLAPGFAGAGAPGMPAANPPVNAWGVLKEYAAGTIDVGRANLSAELNQDPQASASRYAAIVANFDAQRQAAATAIYGLGEAYRKMGRVAEARVQYARILREFVDFSELARQSQRQLSATPVSADLELTGTFGGSAETVEEEKVLLKEEMALLERQLALIQDRIQAGIVPQTEALPLQRDILRVKQQLLRLPRGQGKPAISTPPAPGTDGSGNHEPARVGR